MTSAPVALWRIVITGVVQGAGFRPFVKRLADRHGLTGVVYNNGEAVTVELEGDESAVAHFATHIEREKPPLARIAGCRIEPGDSWTFSRTPGFTIPPPLPGIHLPQVNST